MLPAVPDAEDTRVAEVRHRTMDVRDTATAPDEVSGAPAGPVTRPVVVSDGRSVVDAGTPWAVDVPAVDVGVVVDDVAGGHIVSGLVGLSPPVVVGP